MDDKARVWFARVIAPLAFLAAATLLVIVVQRALDTDDSAGSTQPASTTQAPVSTRVETESGETASQEQFYRIRTGDTLEAIAERFDTTVNELEELNPGIDALALTVGDRIRVS